MHLTSLSSRDSVGDDKPGAEKPRVKIDSHGHEIKPNSLACNQIVEEPKTKRKSIAAKQCQNMLLTLLSSRDKVDDEIRGARKLRMRVD